jgi:hypothetical protein
MRLYIYGFDMNKTNFMSNRVYSLPILPYLDTRGGWDVALSDEADPLFTLSWRAVEVVDAKGSKSWSLRQTNINVFEIREALFSVKDAVQATAFFRAYGPWQIKEHLSLESNPIRLSGLIRQRDFYRDALLSREIWAVQKGSTNEEIRTVMQDWYLWQPLPMEMVFHQPPAVIVRCKDIQDAMRASVFLDRLDGFPWRRCAREDCGRVFKLESKRARIYCSTDCAHLQSVRSYNDRKRAQATKPAKKFKFPNTGRTTSKKGK